MTDTEVIEALEVGLGDLVHIGHCFDTDPHRICGAPGTRGGLPHDTAITCVECVEAATERKCAACGGPTGFPA